MRLGRLAHKLYMEVKPSMASLKCLYGSLLNDNLLIIPQNVRLLDMVESEKLVNTVKWFAGQGGLRLFILDTWARAMVGGDETSAKDAGTAYNMDKTSCKA